MKARREMPERDFGACGRLDGSRVCVVGVCAGAWVGVVVWPFVELSWFVVVVHVGWERGAVGGCEGVGVSGSRSRSRSTGGLDVSIVFFSFLLI